MVLFVVSLKGVSSMRLRRALCITQKSAWFVQRLRESWKQLAVIDGMIRVNGFNMRGEFRLVFDGQFEEVLA